jgi:hypothetical protein
VGEGFEDLQQDDVAIFQAHLQPLLDPDRCDGLEAKGARQGSKRALNVL